MYATTNYRTKKALREAVAAGERVTIFDPGPFGAAPSDGETTLEGPHYPEPHRWYARVTVSGGVVTRVR